MIEITFDRYLNPGTANRQGVELVDENGFVPGGPPIVQYDPVTRVITISNPTPGKAWLAVGQFYKLVFPVATDDGGPFGLRAIDGATIDPSTKTITFEVAAPTGNPPVLPAIDFCADVFPIFAAKRTSTFATKGACTNGACHAAGTGATGVVLETPDEIQRTLIGIEAAETATAANTTPLPPQAAFPVGMPLVDPGDPGNSYLLYKLLLPDQNGVPSARGASIAYTTSTSAGCKAVTAPFDYGPVAAFASADEGARLAAHVVGRRMPWGDWDDATQSFTLGGGTPLTLDEIERVRLWIQEGAEIDDCASCTATMP